jgi:hypothetical protein
VIFPASFKTSNIVDPSEYKICFDPATRLVAVPPAGLKPKVCVLMVVALSTIYHVSTASHCTVVLPVSVPVNLIIALLCSSVVDPSVAVKESVVLAIATET